MVIDCHDTTCPIPWESASFRQQIAAARPYDQQQPSSSRTSPPTSPAKSATDVKPSDRRTDLSLLSPLKIPLGDGPYVRAKQVQLLERDPDRAIALFWAAINAGDRVDSALKDMAIVMKQQNRAEEAIEAVKSFRDRCSEQAQESLDNVMLDLYKKCGKFDEQISLLKQKLNRIHRGLAFNGKRSKTARSQGKKFQLSVVQEATRLLGNLGWAYMQQSNYTAAEAVYRKALSIESDNNKLCNLGVCLLKQGRSDEARVVLQSVTPVNTDGRVSSESHMKSYERSLALIEELDASRRSVNIDEMSFISLDKTSCVQEFDLWSHWKLWEPPFQNRQYCTSEASDSSEEVLGKGEEPGDNWNALTLRHGLSQENVMSDYSLPQFGREGHPLPDKFNVRPVRSLADSATACASISLPHVLRDAAQPHVQPDMVEMPRPHNMNDVQLASTSSVVNWMREYAASQSPESVSTSLYSGERFSEWSSYSGEIRGIPDANFRSAPYPASISFRAHSLESDLSGDADFICVDSVIERLVPDVSEVSDIHLSSPADANSTQPKLPAVVSPVENFTQHRLRVFRHISGL